MSRPFLRALALTSALIPCAAACGSEPEPQPDAGPVKPGEKTAQQICEEHGGTWSTEKTTQLCTQPRPNLPPHLEYFSEYLFLGLGGRVNVTGVIPSFRLYVVPEVGKQLHCAYGEVLFRYLDEDEDLSLASTDCTFTMVSEEYANRTHIITYRLDGWAEGGRGISNYRFKIADGQLQTARWSDGLP